VIIQPPYHAILAANPGRSWFLLQRRAWLRHRPRLGATWRIFVRWRPFNFREGCDDATITADRCESPLARYPFVRQTILMRSMSIGEAAQIRDAAMARLRRLAGPLAGFATAFGARERLTSAGVLR
jgi:hypothetical protein